MADLLEGSFDIDGARVNLLQQAAQVVGIHLHLRVAEPQIAAFCLRRMRKTLSRTRAVPMSVRVVMISPATK
jgi:hypothetical protein